MPKDFVTIRSFSNDVEAQIAKGKLEASGIEAFIVKDDCGGAYPILQSIHGVNLKVAETDAQLAMDILEPETAPKRPPDRYARQKNAIAVWSLVTWLITTVGIGLLIAGLAGSKSLIAVGMLFIIAGVICGIVTRKKEKALNEAPVKKQSSFNCDRETD